MFNIPSIPDSLQKIIIAFGLVLMASCSYLLFAPSELKENREREHQKNVLNTFEKQGEVFLEQKQIELTLLKVSAKLSEKYNVQNPIQQKENSISYTSLIDSNSNNELVEDSIHYYWDKLEVLKFKGEQLANQMKLIKSNRKNYSEIESISSFGFLFGILAGALLFLMGIYRWEVNPKEKVPPGEKPIIDYENFCHSCARNFTYFLERGTDNNGEESKLFCSDCFKEGKFTDYLTDKNFKAYKTRILKSRKFGRDRSRIKQQFKSLIRWKTDEFEKLS